MPSVKVVLYKSKTLSNGEHPVMLRVIVNRKSKYLKVGVNCRADDWDEKTNLPRRSHPLFKEIKIAVQKKELEAEKLVLQMQNESQVLTSSIVVES